MEEKKENYSSPLRNPSSPLRKISNQSKKVLPSNSSYGDLD
jgi:hypothetical protein